MLSDGAIAAIAGAAVGIAGTGIVSWGLQRARFRREDLAGVRERLGIARALDSELRGSRLQIESAIDHGTLPAFTRFTVAAWRDHGPRLLAAMADPTHAALVDVYARLDVLNYVMAAAQPGEPGMSLDDPPDLPDGQQIDLRTHVNELRDKIEVALDLLAQLDGEYLEREAELGGRRTPSTSLPDS